MNKTYLSVLSIAIAAMLVVGAGKEKEVVEGDDEMTTMGKQISGVKKATFFYANDFEKDDETGNFTCADGEVDWVAEGYKKSKGCVKFSKPTETTIAGELYVEWYDAMTSIDFDYFVKDFDEEFYVMARGKRAGGNVRAKVGGYVKGKWAHAKIRASNLAWQSKSGSSDDFSNIVIVGNGPNVANGYILIDNLVIYALGKKKESK